MAKNKTTETESSVADFIKAIPDVQKRKNFSTVVDLLSAHMKTKPKMWGASIVGFGSYHYKYESGHEGDMCLVGLAPRTNAIALYLSNAKEREDLLEKFGKFKMTKGCIYIQKPEDIDTKILFKLADHSVKHLKKLYPG